MKLFFSMVIALKSSSSFTTWAICQRLCTVQLLKQSAVCLRHRMPPPLKAQIELYKACVQKFMLYGSETQPANLEDGQRLHRNEMSMIRLMCRGSPSERDCRDLLKNRLNVTSITELMRRGRLRWFGHIRTNEDIQLRRIQDLVALGDPVPFRPPKFWSEVPNDDLMAKGLAPRRALDRDTWQDAITG